MAASTILIEPDGLRIPSGLPDLASFRAWALADDFPARGRIDYLAGEVHIDMSPEDLGTHGSPKTAVASRLHVLVVEELDLGIVFTDRTRLSCPGTELSVEPDVLVLLDESLRRGRASLVPKADGQAGRYVEVEGAVDLVVECVSDSSADKDGRRLVDLYHRARVREYWLVDARGSEVSLTLYRWRAAGYATVEPDAGGFRRSDVLRRSFRLVRRTRGTGLDAYRLEDRVAVTRPTPRRPATTAKPKRRSR